MTFHEILIPVVAVFIGILVGQHLSDRRENQRKKEELRKTKFLLSHDYSRIYLICKKREKKAKEIHEKLYQDYDFAKRFVNHPEAHTPLMADIIFDAKFVLFDAIRKTGLHRLEWDELGVIVRTHNDIDELTKAIERDWAKLGMDITSIFQKSLQNKESEQVRVTHLRNYLNPYFTIIFSSYRTIWTWYDYIKKITWINLDEAKQPSMEGGIPQTNSGKKIKVDSH